MLRRTERVPPEIVNRCCCVRSAFTERNAVAANRLTESRMTAPRARLIQARVWRGRWATCAVRRSKAARRGARIWCMGLPLVGFFDFDDHPVGEQGEGDERQVEDDAGELHHALGDAVEMRQEAQGRDR